MRVAPSRRAWYQRGRISAFGVLAVLGVMLLTSSRAPADHYCPLVGYEYDHGCSVRYRIELKAWIPHRHVVDPLIDVAVPYLSPIRPSTRCHRPPLSELPDTFMFARFRGDGHEAFEGSFRSLVVAEFGWDGKRLQDFSTWPAKSLLFGPSHLDFEFWPAFQPNRRHRCTTTKTAGRNAGVGVSYPNEVNLRIEAANPLVIGAPDIDSRVTVVFKPNPRLGDAPPEISRAVPLMEVTYGGDAFPSHGFQITRDLFGETTWFATTNDASCLSDEAVNGPIGSLTLLRGLSGAGDDRGREVIDAFEADSGRHLVRHRYSELCTGAYIRTDITHGRGARATARRGVTITPSRGPYTGRALSPARASALGVATVVDPPGPLVRLLTALSERATIRAPAKSVVQTTVLRRGRPRRAILYRARRGPISVSAGPRIVVRERGRRAKPSPPDRSPPRTLARIRARGRIAIIRLVATDRSGVGRTLYSLGGRTSRTYVRPFRVSTRRLASVRFYSVDGFGNVEAPRRARRR